VPAIDVHPVTTEAGGDPTGADLLVEIQAAILQSQACQGLAGGVGRLDRYHNVVVKLQTVAENDLEVGMTLGIAVRAASLSDLNDFFPEAITFLDVR